MVATLWKGAWVSVHSIVEHSTLSSAEVRLHQKVEGELAFGELCSDGACMLVLIGTEHLSQLCIDLRDRQATLPAGCSAILRQARPARRRAFGVEMCLKCPLKFG